MGRVRGQRNWGHCSSVTRTCCGRARGRQWVDIDSDALGSQSGEQSLEMDLGQRALAQGFAGPLQPVSANVCSR